jgi:HK97 family phage major capsid protein
MLYLTKASALAAATAAAAEIKSVQDAVSGRGATATLTPAEQTKYENACVALDAARDDATAHDKSAAKDAERKAWLETPTNRLPQAGGSQEAHPAAGDDEEESDADYSYLDTKSLEFKFRFNAKPLPRAFMKSIRGGAMSELETKSLAKWTTRQRAMERKFSSTQDRDGGLATPPEVRSEIIMRIRDAVFVRQYATTITTQRESVMLPTMEVPSQTTTRVGEKTTVTATEMTNMLGRQRMIPSKRLAIVKCPRELLEDEDFPLVDRIIAMYATTTGEEEEQQFLTGNGNGEPLGIYTALVGTSSEIDIAGATTAMVPEDILDAVYTLHAQYRKRASWTLHRKVIAAIRKMRDLSGGAGTGNWMWQPGLQAGQPDRLVGYPLLESEYVTDPYTGADGDPMLLFGDWSTYYICDRTNLEIVRDDSIYRATDEIGYFIRRRYDGMPTLASPWVRVNRK